MGLEFQYLPANVLGLSAWAARALAERPRPALLPGMTLPRDLAAFPKPVERHESDERNELASTLERELAAFQPHIAVLESVRALRTSGASVIVAGQQPALLGGPLYNIYKALHAVVLARNLSAEWGVPVLPLFWNHADDHDIAEVHHLWIQNKSLDLRKVGLAGVSSGRTRLGHIRLDEEQHKLVALGELLRQNMKDGEGQEAALELFLPRAGETFSSAFTRTLLSLFGHLGLIVLEPQWIRQSLSNTLARVVAQNIGPALDAGAQLVRVHGRDAPIAPTEAAIVFRHIDGKRHALRLKDGAYRYDGEEGSRNGVELAAEIVQAPLEWSAGALLRPIAQDLVLPVAAYIGGWGELAYHSQLGPMRALAGAPNTPFVPRLSATLVDGGARESLAKLELTIQEVLDRRGHLEPESPAVSPKVAEDLRAVARRTTQDLLALREDVAVLDRGLAQHVKRTTGQIEDLVGKLAAKLERVHANSAGIGRRHYRRLANGLFPNELPQERVRGALEFVSQYGTAWIDELIAGIDPLPTEHLIAYLPS